jgi:adenylyltransferase/sulfurtransferase
VLGVLQALEAVKLLSGAGDVLSGRLLLFDALAGRFNSIKLRGRAPGCVACGQQPEITQDSISSYDYEGFTGGQRANDGPPKPLEVLPAEQRITAQELQQLLTAANPVDAAAGSPGQQQQQAMQPPVLLDVRPPEQFAIMRLPDAVSMPYMQFDKHLPAALQLCGIQQEAGLTQPLEVPGGVAAAETDTAAAAAAAAAANSNAGSGRRVVVMCRRGNHSQLAVQRLREAGVLHAVDVVGGYEAWAQQVDTGLPLL